jgi:glutamate 5-kinase
MASVGRWSTSSGWGLHGGDDNESGGGGCRTGLESRRSLTSAGVGAVINDGENDEK